MSLCVYLNMMPLLFNSIKPYYMRTIFSITIIFIMLGVINSAKAQANDTLKTATIKIKGISCTMDLPIIKKKLVNEEGIDDVTYSELKSEAVFFTVKYHTAIITEQQIRSAIENAPSCDDPSEKPYKVKSFKAEPAKK